MGPINSLSFVCPFVRPFVRSCIFLGIRSLLFSETLAQVRVPEMKKSDRARFLGKSPYLGISGGKRPKIDVYFYFEISTLLLPAIGAN